MALETGTRLGAFEITGQIGVGGMGEVYRATDTKLGREVAIKTLPAALAEDQDRLARFEREAKILASLNHAHIASVHSLDEVDGALYIAMELVEGETLEERIKASALPVEEALQLGLQIALALEAAHDKGVVHRDLKPANIMITPDDVVKVLDFGLAKAFSGNPNEASPAHSPTLSAAMTQAGLVLGTAGYMSPEQASGPATDQRADIWSFGILLYEMLTGTPVFSGESVPHILAAVLKTEPDWTRLPKPLHPRVRQLLERCLEKKVRNRYHSIADVRVDLEKALADPEGAAALPPGYESAAAPSIAVRAALALSFIALGGVIAALAIWSRTGPGPEQVLASFSVRPPEGVNLDLTIWAIPFEISPNGRDLAFVGKSGATRQLYIRPLATPDADARPIPGTEGALSPFWSPDSEWVGFSTGGSLRRARVSGGPPTVETIVDTPGDLWGGRDWNADGEILLSVDGGITKVTVGEGSATPVLTLDGVPGAQALRFPVFVGDGEAFLFVSTGGTAAMYVGSADGETLRKLMEFGNDHGSTLRYADGHVFYVENGTLWARPFDETVLDFAGEARRILEGIPVSPFTTAPYSVSQNGRLAYRTLPLTEAVEFRWFDHDGAAQEAVGEPVYLDGWDLSPDGTELAMGRVVERGAVELWHHAIESGSPRPLVEGTLETVPRFSSDGENLVFHARRDDPNRTNLYSIHLSDLSQQRVLSGDINLLPQFWNARDDRIIYTTPTGGDGDLWVKDLTDDSDVDLPLNSAAGEMFAALSPDGELMAFTTNESGESQLWLATYPEGRRLRQVSRGFANEPCWSGDGAELYYIGENRMLTAVRVDTSSGTVALGEREALFPLTDAIDAATQPSTVRRVLACAPDGRFLVAMRAPPEQDPLQILIGWDERSNDR